MAKAKRKLELTGDNLKKDMPLYTIGVVAELMGTTNQTLRLYEKHGLVKPARKKKNRFYSDNDIRWLLCLRELIHMKKFSIEGIKKLLEYAPCYEITECPPNRKNECRAYMDRAKPCWELNEMICKKKPINSCEKCAVFLSKNKNKAGDDGEGKGF